MSLAGILRRARAEACERSGWNARSRRRLDGSRAAVLMYHRVLPESEARERGVEPAMNVTPESFEAQLDWLSRHFEVLPVAELVTRREEDRPLPRRALAITFDDGWLDNLEYALPALERRGWPATIFVVSERVGGGAFWPDEVSRRLDPLSDAERSEAARELDLAGASGSIDSWLETLKALSEDERAGVLDRIRAVTREPADFGRELLTWDELDRLARGGFDVESHGATHAILTGLPANAMERELAAPRASLRERGHGGAGLLAYPSGAHDASVRAAADRVGYRAAFTTARGLMGPDHDRLALPRLGIHQGIAGSAAELLTKVPGAA